MMLKLNRRTCALLALPVLLSSFTLTAQADLALLLKEEHSGYVPDYLTRRLSCRIEPTRVIKTTTIGFFTRTESSDIQLDDQDSLRRLMFEAQRAGITDSGMVPTDVGTVSWSASINSEGDLRLGGIESGRYYYNESNAANALRFMIDSLCGTLPEPG